MKFVVFISRKYGISPTQDGKQNIPTHVCNYLPEPKAHNRDNLFTLLLRKTY